jgi:uncharacterized protein (TIGR02284 family)
MPSHSIGELEVLNELLEVTVDSVAGYREAAADAGNPEFQKIFRQRAEDRQRIVDRLSAAVRKAGGRPTTEGSLLGAAHRVFLNVRELVSKGDAAIVQEVERGEDFIRKKYEAAIEGNRLSPTAKELVQTAYGSVWSGHEEASVLSRGGTPIRPRAL